MDYDEPRRIDHPRCESTMKASEFRKMALRLNGAIESSHMKHPDFRVAGKIFATLSPDETRGMVKLNAEQQRAMVASCSDVFVPCNGAWGRQGCTFVMLADADKSIVQAALQLAHENIVQAAAAKKKSPSRKSSRPKRKRKR